MRRAACWPAASAALRADAQTLVDVQSSINEDLKRWPDILHAGTSGKPCCTNSSQLPVGFTAAACRELVRRALTRFRLPDITVTPAFSVCPVHGCLAGEHPYCPLCDAEKLAAKRQAIERQQQARAA